MQSEIYVANATLQHCQLSYRRREDMRIEASPRVLEIPAAGQAQFPGLYDSEGIQHIINQLHRRGGVPHDDLEAIKRPHTLVYRIQKFMDKDTIGEAIELDITARETVAAEQMEASGLKAFTGTQTILRENGMGAVAEHLAETSIKIVEVDDGGEVKNGADLEVIVSKKKGKAGRFERHEKN